ncbi:replication-relaxation family protein [Actinomadura decatromicini]|nr:replication-relaxation family protein [Actinomadura decatromicini]
MRARYVTARRVAGLGATLTDRERAIVGTLGAVRVATARQLVALHCADVRPRQARAVLASLADRQVLARLKRVVGGARAGSAGYVYTLGPAGLRLLASAGSRPRRPWELGPLFLAHNLAVTELYVGLMLAVRAGEIGAVEFAAEPACWRSFFGPGGERVTLKPDAYLRSQLGRYVDRWFVEVDLGTESRTTLARKADRYRQYWRSGSEQAKTGVFPRVIFLVPDEHRREVITEVLGRQPAEAWPLFAVARTDEAVTRLAQGAGV